MGSAQHAGREEGAAPPFTPQISPRTPDVSREGSGVPLRANLNRLLTSTTEPEEAPQSSSSGAPAHASAGAAASGRPTSSSGARQQEAQPSSSGEAAARSQRRSRSSMGASQVPDPTPVLARAMHVACEGTGV